MLKAVGTGKRIKNIFEKLRMVLRVIAEQSQINFKVGPRLKRCRYI